MARKEILGLELKANKLTTKIEEIVKTDCGQSENSVKQRVQQTLGIRSLYFADIEARLGPRTTNERLKWL